LNIISAKKKTFFSKKQKMQVYAQDQSFVVVCGTDKWKIYIDDKDCITLSQYFDAYDETKKLQLNYTANPHISMKSGKIYFGKKMFFKFKDQDLCCFFNHKCMQKIHILSEYELYQKLYPGPYKRMRVFNYQKWPDCVWLLWTLESVPPQYEIEFPISESLNVKQSLIH
jgi:hypothetical protein